MGSVHFPMLNEMELQQLVNRENVEMEILRQDLTREYHEKIAERELALRQSLYQSHSNAMPQQEVFVKSALELLRRHNVIAELLTEDFTRKYNERVQELELAFKQRRFQLHLHAISKHEVIPSPRTQQKRSRPEKQERDIANNLHKRKKKKKKSEVLSKKLQKDSSKSVDSKLPEGPGWCSVCEVDCRTEKSLEQHILAKNHQSMLEKLGQGSAGKREQKSKQLLSVTEKKPKERDIIDNLHEQEKQITKEDILIPSKDMQNDCSRSLGSGLPERPGWCALCEVQCTSENDLKKHILGKKHKSKVASEPHPIRSSSSCSKGSK